MEPPVIDMRGIVCGLIPALSSKLTAMDLDRATVLVDPGMAKPLFAAFSSTGKWQLDLTPQITHEEIAFTRLPDATPDPLALF